MKFDFAIERLQSSLGSLLILKKYKVRTKTNLDERIREIQQAIKILERESKLWSCSKAISKTAKKDR